MFFLEHVLLSIVIVIIIIVADITDTRLHVLHCDPGVSEMASGATFSPTDNFYTPLQEACKIVGLQLLHLPDRKSVV